MSEAHSQVPRTAVPAASRPLLAERFDGTQIAELRRTVAFCAQAAGLRGQPLDDFVLAVHELVTNAVRHGGGHGWLRLWHAEPGLLCEVSDHGTGIADEWLHDRGRPAPNTEGGWGLWLARELSYDMLVQTGPTGTTVRISAAIDRTATSASP